MTQNILEYFLNLIYSQISEKQGNAFYNNNGCNYDTIYVLYFKNGEIHLKYQLSRFPTKSPHGILSLYTRRHISSIPVLSSHHRVLAKSREQTTKRDSSFITYSLFP